MPPGNEMGVLAIVEIERQSDGRLPLELIRTAYRASRRGQVVLVLKDVSPKEVNRDIDALVRTMPLNIPGILYVDGAEVGKLAGNCASANMVFVSPATAMSWRSWFHFRNEQARPINAAAAALDRISRPARLSELPPDPTAA